MRLPLLSLVALLAACRTDKSTTTDTDDGSTGGALDADGDGFTIDEDCDDGDDQISPAAVELCDGVDNNCDGTVDEGVTSTFYADADGDGFGSEDAPAEACSEPSGYVGVGNDCDDSDPDSYPGAAERCDSIDNDCDGTVDEDVLGEWYADADDDGYGDPDSAYEVCDPPPGYVSNADDCDDTDASALPGGVEVCDEADNDCDGTVDEDVTTTFYQDADGDNYGVADVTTESCDRPTGYAALTGDCDDGNDDISPNGVEVCDGVDNDCDGVADEADAVDAETWYADGDGDGYGSTAAVVSCDAPSGYADNSDDCDDADKAVSPAATEVCNGTDDDCNGWADDADPGVADATTWYADADGDGYGSGRYTTRACDAPSGYVDNADDCNDADDDALPGGTEVCDGVDNDCDGSTDEDAADVGTWYTDADGDGYGDAGSSTAACSQPSGTAASSTDCDDSDADIRPGGVEVCDGADNDCDGSTDEASATDAATWYADSDGDGYGDAGSSTAACSRPSGYVADSSDCDDGDAGEGGPSVWYIDLDGDGYGASAYTARACTAPSGFVSSSTDCNDGSSASYPGAAEVCDRSDNDCDGSTDEGVTITFYADTDGDGYGDDGMTTEGCSRPSGYVEDGEDCDDGDAGVSPEAEEVCDGVDNDCDGDSDDGVLGASEACAAADCEAILDAGDDDGDGLYWLDPDGDGADAWEAYCDMTTDGGGWTKLYSSLYPTWWSKTAWEDVGLPEDDDYSALAFRDDFEESGVWELRFEVGNSGTWDTGVRAHYTIWTQEHDPFSDTTDGSDYTYVAGQESTTCSGFNGLHDRYFTAAGVYAMSSDVDLYDSVGCWWMQLVPLQQYVSASSYPGYLEGYDGPNVHLWHVLWVR